MLMNLGDQAHRVKFMICDRGSNFTAAFDAVLADAGIRPHRSLDAAAPLKPLPEPVDLGQYRVRKRARVGGLINEYRLVA